MNAKYIHLQWKDGRTLVEGSSECFVGQRIDRLNDAKTQGVFAKWEWDGASLKVTNCRYGFNPLYYFIRPDEICVSTSIRQLLDRGAPIDLDDEAISVFLRFGWFLGEDTPFRAIRAVPPNAEFEWRNGKLHVAGSYSIPKPDYLSRDAAIDLFNDLFRQSIQRRLPGDAAFVMPLSGGRDSRHILLELVEQGAKPEFCFTADHIPTRANEDARIAAILTRTLGLNHEILDQPKSRLRSEMKKNELTEFCAIEHAWAIPISEFCRGRISWLYDGLAGDMLTGGVAAAKLNPENLTLYESGHFEELATEIYSWTEEISLKGWLQREWYKKFGPDIATARICDELRRHSNAPNPVGSFHFWNRTRRGVSTYSFGILRDIPTVCCPYLDDDVYDLLASLPASMLLDGQFHTDAIHRAYPKFRNIPFEDKSASKQDSRTYYRNYARELTRFLIGRRHSQIVNTSFLIPRMIRWSFSREPVNLSWMEPEYAIYLLQLENLLENARRVQ